jgi:predicted GNAT family N-acyltransferase
MEILKKLQQFINIADDRYFANEWIEDDDMKVYVRKGRRLLDGKMRITLEIGNVVVNPELRGQGRFTTFFYEAIKMNPWDAIYVECVWNARLAVFLIKQGMLSVPQHEQCYYLMQNLKK